MNVARQTIATEDQMNGFRLALPSNPEVQILRAEGMVSGEIEFLKDFRQEHDQTDLRGNGNYQGQFPDCGFAHVKICLSSNHV